jgi:uncharacterized membrane protein YjfL (UPF0719 family)
MDLLSDLLRELVSAVLYGGLGLLLLTAGYFMLDVMIPGRIGELLVVQRSRNVGLVVSAGLLSIGIVVGTALWSAEGDLSEGLSAAAGYGVLGILLLAATFRVVDLKTPGRLGEIIRDDHDHPVAWVLASMLLAAGIVQAAAIS